MYEPHYEEESGGGGFLIGLLCGTALGAAIGLMFAPKAGSEFRQRLYDSTGDIRRKAYETYDQASEQVNTVATKARQAVERGQGSVRQRAAVSVRSVHRRQRQHDGLRHASRRRVRLQHRLATDRRRVGTARTRQRQRAESRRGSLLFALSHLPLHLRSLSPCQPVYGIARAIWPASARINTQNGIDSLQNVVILIHI